MTNWCAAGFSPAEFWEQSVATFNAAMKGAVERRQIDHEMAVATGWWTTYLHGQKRMGPLGKYLKMIRGGKKTAAERSAEIVTAFKSMAKRGLSVKVRRIPRGE